MGISDVKSIAEPTQFLGGFSLKAGCYCVATIGLVVTPLWQTITWLDDDTEDSNVDIIESIVIAIEIFQYVLLFIAART